MKQILFCLSLIVGFNASAESPIMVEPIFLEALFAQSGSLDVKDLYETPVKLSEILGGMGYPVGEDTVITVSHVCDYENSGHTCRLTFNISSVEDGVVVRESAMIITYSPEFVKGREEIKIPNVKVDYAG